MVTTCSPRLMTRCPAGDAAGPSGLYRQPGGVGPGDAPFTDRTSIPPSARPYLTGLKEGILATTAIPASDGYGTPLLSIIAVPAP